MFIKQQSFGDAKLKPLSSYDHILTQYLLIRVAVSRYSSDRLLQINVSETTNDCYLSDRFGIAHIFTSHTPEKHK